MSEREDQPGRGTDRPKERADAARNRARVLAAAEVLFSRRRPVTMEDVARAAGVGRGTLYRRYPDVPSIALALLDEHERQVQEQLLRGEPPLGPGAPPHERMGAFYAAVVGLLERHGHLALGAELGRARFATGAYGFWRAHVRALLTEAGVSDVEALVDSLLAPVAPEVYDYQRNQRGLSPEQITAGLSHIAESVLNPHRPP